MSWSAKLLTDTLALVQIVVSSLFFKIMWGWFAILLFQKREDFSERQLKFSLGFLTLFFILGVASIWSQRGTPAVESSFYGGLASYLGMVSYTWLRISATKTLAAAVALFSPLLSVSELGVPSLLSHAVGSMVLGGILACLFLGHWYPNDKQLNIVAFKRSLRVVAICIGIKSGEFLMLTSQTVAMKLQSQWPLKLTVEKMLHDNTFWLVLARTLVGILIPTLCLWIVFDRLRAGQKNYEIHLVSGLLYGAGALVLVGETVSIFTALGLGIVL